MQQAVQLKYLHSALVKNRFCDIIIGEAMQVIKPSATIYIRNGFYIKYENIHSAE